MSTIVEIQNGWNSDIQTLPDIRFLRWEFRVMSQLCSRAVASRLPILRPQAHQFSGGKVFGRKNT